MNLFELATRENYLFESVKGLLTVQDLWNLPLTVTNNQARASLDNIAVSLNNQLKGSQQESFVTETVKTDVVLANKLEIVKHIIAVRKQEAKVASEAKAKADEKARLLALLAKKQEQSLESLSEDEIKAKLEQL